MRKLPMLMIFTACVTLLLGACTASAKDAPLCRITFERDHGSMWGNQFYVEVCETEVILVCYIPAGSSDPVVQEHLPITPETWQALTDAIGALELQQEQVSFLPRLGADQKMDGTEYRKLTLQYGTKEIRYRWPTDPGAAELEALLEALVSTECVTDPTQRNLSTDF